MSSADTLAVELQQLMSSRGFPVQGVGIGSKNGHPILIVYLGSLPPEASNIPKTFDGIPVKVVRTGMIRPARSARN
jgi:hypothetical protein